MSAHALRDKVIRIGTDEAAAQVIAQSVGYGTRIFDAMTAYAIGISGSCKMKAVRTANMLPLQMPGIMATLMQPALFILFLGPTVIRDPVMGR